MGNSGNPIAITMLYVLIGLKTLWDLVASNASAREDVMPPSWLLKVAAKIRKAQGNEAKWQHECEETQRYAIDDEKLRRA